LVFTQSAIEVLQAYQWPGNIRELGNLIAYLGTMTDEDEIDIADLPPKFRDAARQIGRSPRQATEAMTPLSFYEKVAEFEKSLLIAEYQKLNGNITQLALALEMDRSHLYTKLKEFGIHSTRKSG
jgi:two-component system nitrogen regulation response regulator NtrX